MDINQIRRLNLQQILDEHFEGKSKGLAVKVNKQPSTLSRILQRGEKRRNMGDQLAREIENAMGLERGWMDVQHADQKTILEDLLFEVIDYVETVIAQEGLEDELDPHRRAKLYTELYALSEKAGRIDKDTVRSMIRLAMAA